MVALVSSCAKNPAKLLIKKDGKWLVATTITTSIGTFTDASTATFTDGSVTMVDAASTSTTSTWTYDKKTAVLTVTTVDGSDTYVDTYNVTEIEKDSEKWTLASETLNGAGVTLTGITIVATLTRI